MNDIRRTILWVIFGFSMVLLWDQWQVHNGNKATFFPSPAQKTAVVAEKTAAPSRGATGVRAAAPSPDEAPAARLSVTAGPLKGTSLPLSSAPVLIGRAPTCTLVIDDDYCSARHCRIFPEHGEWKVEDLGSTNGTYLGNQKVTDPVPLRRGDQVRIGATTLELTQ